MKGRKNTSKQASMSMEHELYANATGTVIECESAREEVSDRERERERLME